MVSRCVSCCKDEEISAVGKDESEISPVTSGKDVGVGKDQFQIKQDPLSSCDEIPNSYQI